MDNEASGPFRTEVCERILRAAAGLFAQSGYKGTSTREIATTASVNEVTIYRYYPRKRDLYVAVLGTELQTITLRGDLLSRIAAASDGPTALAQTFRLIAVTFADRYKLLRLVQYGTLELNEEFDPLLRQHLGELVEVISRYLEPWVERGDLGCNSAKTLVLTLIAIVLTHHPLHRIFSAECVSADAMFRVYSRLCTIEATFSTSGPSLSSPSATSSS